MRTKEVDWRSAWFRGRVLVASGAFAELSVKLWLTALFCRLNVDCSICYCQSLLVLMVAGCFFFFFFFLKCFLFV